MLIQIQTLRRAALGGEPIETRIPSGGRDQGADAR
jgi:hypothetical protein